MIKKFLVDRMVKTFKSNKLFINKIIREYSKIKKRMVVLDVGCGNGQNTNIFLKAIKNFEVYGIDIQNSCNNKLLKYKKINLEDNSFPFKDDIFDLVYSNQVLEHVLNKDKFISECHRVLKKRGLFILSTESISSLDNIISVLLGQEPVTQHTSSRYITSSILSPHFMEKISEKDGNKYLHKNVCSYYGLLRLVKINGFKNIKIKSFGNICRIFELLFPIYNRLLTVYGLKE